MHSETPIKRSNRCFSLPQLSSQELPNGHVQYALLTGYLAHSKEGELLIWQLEIVMAFQPIEKDEQYGIYIIAPIFSHFTVQ